MSTRANIIIKDRIDKLYFYRHSDGYPEGTLPTLEKFMCYVNEGKIRDNVQQAAGWLIIIGAFEYRGDQIPYEERQHVRWDKMEEYAQNKFGDLMPAEPVYWKVGAYEPTTCIHGDIQYLYIVDLEERTISVIREGFDQY